MEFYMKSFQGLYLKCIITFSLTPVQLDNESAGHLTGSSEPGQMHFIQQPYMYTQGQTKLPR